MFIRALRSDEKDLFREAHGWAKDAPEWLRQLDRICGRESFEDYYEECRAGNFLAFGVFETELVALITIAERAKGIFEVEFLAKRSTPPELLVEAGCVLREEMFRRGMLEGFSWVATLNRPALAVNRVVGFRKTGITLLKGAYRGRVIEWQRLSLGREEWLNGRAESQTDAADSAGEHLRLPDADGHARHRCAA